MIDVTFGAQEAEYVDEVAIAESECRGRVEDRRRTPMTRRSFMYLRIRSVSASSGTGVVGRCCSVDVDAGLMTAVDIVYNLDIWLCGVRS